LIDSGIIRRWFLDFRQYWIDYLMGRPLRLHDFFWLHSHYRSMYQDIGVEANKLDSVSNRLLAVQFTNIEPVTASATITTATALIKS